MKNETCTPVELEPRELWLCKRRNALREAINNRMRAYLDVPTKWIEEYNQINAELKKVQ